MYSSITVKYTHFTNKNSITQYNICLLYTSPGWLRDLHRQYDFDTILCFGDCRPLHKEAKRWAKSKGISLSLIHIWATAIPSPTKRTSCSDMPKSTVSRIQHFLWMTDTAVQTMTAPDFSRCCQKSRQGKWLWCCRKTFLGWDEIPRWLACTSILLFLNMVCAISPSTTTLTPVSYTHLDVYKRQLSESFYQF